MAEETPPKLALLTCTKEQLESRHQRAISLTKPVTHKGKNIQQEIIDQNIIAAANPQMGQLIGLYTHLQECAVAGIPSSSQSREQWIGLVSYTCEFILKEGESSKVFREMFSDLFNAFRGLKEQEPPDVLGSLAFLVGSSLQKGGINFSPSEIKETLGDWYPNHPEEKERVEEEAKLLWIEPPV